MVTTVFVDTAIVVMGNVADNAPAGTVTFGGTVAFLDLLLASVTTTPLAGAGPVKVTFPTELRPPLTLAGFIVIEASAAGLTDRFAVLTTPEYEAVMLPIVTALTAAVVIAKLAEV